MALADTANLIVDLSLKGNFTSKISSAGRALQGFDRQTSNTQRALGKFGQNIQRGILLGTTAAVGGFIAVAKAAGDFEAQLNTIGTIVDRGQLKGIGEQLRKIARDTGLSLDDLTSAYYDLASAGVKGTLATAALNDAVTLGIGGLATTAETVNLIATAINAYGLDAAGAAKATDQFALAIADGVVKASDIAATFSNVASIAKTFHVGIDQIAASYAFLTAQGVPAAEVTTEMQRAIISLIKPTAELDAAQKALGISFTKEIATKGLVGALQELRVYSDKTGIPLIDLLGRIEAVKYTLQTTGPSFKGYNAELAKMGNAAGTAAKQMAERQQGLNFQLARLKALAKDAGITIGSALLPKLTPLVDKLNTLISDNQDKIADFGTKLADGFTKFADAVGKVDWQPFIDGLRLSASIAQTAVKLFMSLPKELQAAAIGGFAINKLTGGLPTAIAKDVGGALIGKLARGGSPANPLFVKDVSGGAAGTPGKLGGVASALGKVFIVGAAIGVFAELRGILSEQGVANRAQGAALSEQGALYVKSASFDEMTKSLAGIKQLQYDLTYGLTPEAIAYQLDIDGVKDRIDAEAARLQTAIDKYPPLARDQLQAIKDGSRDSVAATKAGAALGAFSAKLVAANLAAALEASLSAVQKDFREGLAGLRKAVKPVDIAKFAKEIAAAVKGGAGSAKGTASALGILRVDLAKTHDPELQRVLRAAIKELAGKLPGRQKIEALVADAKKTAGGTESSAKKLADLKVIERDILHRGGVHAAAEVRKLEAGIKATDSLKAKLAARFGEQISATKGVKKAVDKKDLSVSLTVPVAVGISIRDLGKTIKTAAVYYGNSRVGIA